LIKHNPSIIWKEYKLHLNSDHCKKICNNINFNAELKYEDKGENDNPLNLFDHHEVIATTLSQTNEDIPTNIEIPKEYHDFSDVFDEKASNQLSPHRPYDHKIPLLPNTNPPFGPIYSLSELELKE